MRNPLLTRGTAPTTVNIPLVLGVSLCDVHEPVRSKSKSLRRSNQQALRKYQTPPYSIFGLQHADGNAAVLLLQIDSSLLLFFADNAGRSS